MATKPYPSPLQIQRVQHHTSCRTEHGFSRDSLFSDSSDTRATLAHASRTMRDRAAGSSLSIPTTRHSDIRWNVVPTDAVLDEARTALSDAVTMPDTTASVVSLRDEGMPARVAASSHSPFWRSTPTATEVFGSPGSFIRSLPPTLTLKQTYPPLDIGFAKIAPYSTSSTHGTDPHLELTYNVSSTSDIEGRYHLQPDSVTHSIGGKYLSAHYSLGRDSVTVGINGSFGDLSIGVTGDTRTLIIDRSIPTDIFTGNRTSVGATAYVNPTKTEAALISSIAGGPISAVIRPAFVPVLRGIAAIEATTETLLHYPR